MLKRLLSLTAVTLTLFSASITATATNTGFTTLNLNGETVKIYRDDFGTPHIFAETNRGLFEAYGYDSWARRWRNWREYFYSGPKRVLTSGVAEQLCLRSTLPGPARAVQELRLQTDEVLQKHTVAGVKDKVKTL